MRQLDAEVVGHAGRPGGEDDHAGAEEHRLGDAVGDEHDRLAASFQMRSSSRFIFSRVSASSAPNGSSIRISFGSWTSARAIAARCCMPPESS